MHYDKININGVNIFYRENETKDKPNLVLLHGFPSASHMYRNLMPMLNDRFHQIAPDYPGFGQSDAPDRDKFTYSFENITDYIDDFLAALKIDKFFMYVFDYGAPIGFRIANRHPERILGIISQNGNVYEEGLGEKWTARKAYWKNPTLEQRKQFESAFAPETIIGQYTFGTEKGSVSPDGFSLDIYYSLTIPDYAEKQSDLILDYRSNVELYPTFQEYLRKYKPQLLAIWGKNDSSFIPPGAYAFQKDDPAAVVHLVNSGHFALESCCEEICGRICTWLEGIM